MLFLPLLDSALSLFLAQYNILITYHSGFVATFFILFFYFLNMLAIAVTLELFV